MTIFSTSQEGYPSPDMIDVMYLRQMLRNQLCGRTIMVPKNTSKRGDRRARQNKSSGVSRVTTVLSQSESFDRQLAVRSDMITVKDRTLNFLVTGSTGAGTSLAVGLLPSASVSFGARMSNIATNYSRYRIVKIIVRYIPIVGTTTSGRVAIGVLDDASGDLTTVPASVPSISSLRCSHTNSPYKEIEFTWKPIDSEKWYYLSDLSGQDQRFVIQATLLACGDQFGATTSAGSIELLYTVQLDGAFTAQN